MIIPSKVHHLQGLESQYQHLHQYYVHRDLIANETLGSCLQMHEQQPVVHLL